jgi:hypothetical protein
MLARCRWKQTILILAQGIQHSFFKEAVARAPRPGEGKRDEASDTEGTKFIEFPVALFGSFAF